MQELEQRSRGIWRPSPGSVYPALQQLEDEGLVQAESEGSGRLFNLTDKGREYVETHKSDVEAPWHTVGSAADESMFDLFGQVRSIGTALFQVAQSGTPAQIEQARKILSEARRALYRILAEEPEAADAAGSEPESK